MTANEAYQILTRTYSGLTVLSCYEYRSRFVFNAVPTEHANKKAADEFFDSLYSVKKTDGNCTRFKPTDISTDEYDNGRRIALDKRTMTVRETSE